MITYIVSHFVVFVLFQCSEQPMTRTPHKHGNLSDQKPAAQAPVKDPYWCNSTNRQNPPIHQNHHKCWTNNGSSFLYYFICISKLKVWHSCALSTRGFFGVSSFCVTQDLRLKTNFCVSTIFLNPDLTWKPSSVKIIWIKIWGENHLLTVSARQGQF